MATGLRAVDERKPRVNYRIRAENSWRKFSRSVRRTELEGVSGMGMRVEPRESYTVGVAECTKVSNKGHRFTCIIAAMSVIGTQGD